MKKKENNRGITLIALVITIIIMIILVAVSVALVVKGDLFGNAQQGTEDTRKEAEKEQLTEYVYGQYKQNEATKKVEVDLNEVKTILNADKDKFNEDAKIDGDKLTVTGNSGKVYVVYKNGAIEEKANKPEGEFPKTFTLNELIENDIFEINEQEHGFYGNLEKFAKFIGAESVDELIDNNLVVKMEEEYKFVSKTDEEGFLCLFDDEGLASDEIYMLDGWSIKKEWMEELGLTDESLDYYLELRVWYTPYDKYTDPIGKFGVTSMDDLLNKFGDVEFYLVDLTPYLGDIEY